MSIKINGTAGIEMASDDSLTFGDVAINRDNVGGRKNAIINGGMDVSQRGSSFPLSGSTGEYTIDRWLARAGTDGVMTVTQEAMNNSTEPFGSNFLRCNQTTARTSAFSMLQYRIESLQSIPIGDITLSFWAKGTASKQINLTLYQNFGTGGEADVVIHQTDFVLSANWTKYAITLSYPSLFGRSIDTTDDNLIIEFRDETLGTFTFDIAQVQLEAGSQATPFERRSYGEELALCQRYYYKHLAATTGDTDVNRIYASNYGASAGFVHINYPVQMRSNPTVTYSTNGPSVVMTYNSQTRLQAYAGSSNTWRIWDFTADAEL